MTRILLTGASGQLAHALAPLLAPLGELIVTTRAELDLADIASIAPTLEQIAPHVIVNAAAYTAVDNAERDRDLAFRVNAEAPGILAQFVADRDGLLVHYSTDYVFDGTGTRPYREDDPVSPLGVYAQSKTAGERAIAATGATHLILRTAWLYGATGHNFACTMLRLARERDVLSVVNDQRGTPTWTGRVAQVTTQILTSLGVSSAALSSREWTEATGIYHCTNSGEATWFEFAQAVLRADPRREEQRATRVEPITSAEYPTAAPRPMYTVLDTARIRERFGVVLPPWEADLERALLA